MFFVLLGGLAIFYLFAFILPRYHPGMGLLGGNPHVKVGMCGHPKYAAIREGVTTKKKVERLFGNPACFSM